MSIGRPPRLLLWLAAGGAWLALPDAPLRVLRVTPARDLRPGDTVLVTFDRPVAGSADAQVDPARVLRVEPATPGHATWRDPVTLAWVPARTPAADTRLTVTVDTSVAALDGARLAEPHVATLRAAGPLLVTGRPASPNEAPRWLGPTPTFDVVFTAAAEPAAVAAAARLRLAPTCTGGARAVALVARGTRPLGPDDPWEFRWMRPVADSARREGATRADTAARRVVTLAPAEPLPLDCAGTLVLPVELAPSRAGDTRAWAFSTYGPLELVGGGCSEARLRNAPPPPRVDPCPTGPVVVRFSTPVRGSEVRRAVRILPATAFTVGDTSATRDTWVLDATLAPRTTYAIAVDTSLRDVFGQRLRGNPAIAATTTGWAPTVEYAFGRLTVERRGYATLPVGSINTDTLVVSIAPVPEQLEAEFLKRGSWSWRELWPRVAARATVRRVPVAGTRDRFTTTRVAIPPAGAPGATGAASRQPTLYAVRVRGVPSDTTEATEIALVQVTDLAVHAKLGVEDGVVWVTGVSDGLARAGAAVTVHAPDGRAVATAITDAGGVARLPRIAPTVSAAANGGSDFQGYVAVTLAGDRAVAGVSEWGEELSIWQFDVDGAYGDARVPAAGAVFTERGIYRPGEMVHAKAIVRRGALGALRLPGAGDSARFTVTGREGAQLHQRTLPLSAYGTASLGWTIPERADVGQHVVRLEARLGGRWVALGDAGFRVGDYRPPEFLVDVALDGVVRPAAGGRTPLPGDTLRATVQARYLFGAPMARAAVKWSAVETPLEPWELEIPNSDGWEIGDTGRWWEDESSRTGSTVFAQGTDTLGADGSVRLVVARTPDTDVQARRGAVRRTVVATVTDVNRQDVSALAGGIAHPADFYLGARTPGGGYFWTAGQPRAIEVMAVRPDGRRVADVPVRVRVVRREWHQAQRMRNGAVEHVGEWVSDTVARCAVRTAASDASPARCSVTPAEGGEYTVHLAATDARGREAVTTLSRWVAGKGWVPWEDGSRFRMEVVTDKARYAPGDTATILFASPFTDVEALVTVEREGILEQRRLRVTSGTTTLKLPITEAHAPDVYVSMVVARGRIAQPGRLDDAGRPAIRIGYAKLRVTPESRRLAVEVAPARPEYRPGDTASVRVTLRDAKGVKRKGEVALWAVDEGVLSLTRYRTPDPLDLLYRERGLGVRLASTLATVAAQHPIGEKGGNPGGSGGIADGDLLRSRFRTTAFFIASAVTDDSGTVTLKAPLPDNLTTFRVMAVAATATDRYGSGSAPLLVTRPLVARPALPRFVRPGDELLAGAVVNRRTGGTAPVTVSAEVQGVQLAGDATQRATLEAGTGKEVRFALRVPKAGDGSDSASVTITARGGTGEADAVRARIPFRPDFPTRAWTATGTTVAADTVRWVLPAGIDPARSRLALSLGTSPAAVLRGALAELRVYPYECTEQVTSGARVLAAVLRMAPADSGVARARRELATAVAMLERRQRTDGGIGYWSAEDWTTPGLSAHAGLALLEARAAGVRVSDSTLARVAAYLRRGLAQPLYAMVPVSHWYRGARDELAERVQAAEFLRALGRPDVAAENRLLARAGEMAWEDRALLAGLLAARAGNATTGAGARDREAALQLLAPLWASLRVEGRRALLPDSAYREWYFASSARPAARLLAATLVAAPAHSSVGPLAEALVARGREGRGSWRWGWTTQDQSVAAVALAAYDVARRSAPAGTVRVRALAGGRVLVESEGRTDIAARGDRREPAVALTGLLARERGMRTDSIGLAVVVERQGEGPAWWWLTVHEVPRELPVTPDDRGIRVERWTERFDARTPVTDATEGDLVRVWLRVTVREDRDFVVLDDPLPAGLEAVDLSLRTVSPLLGQAPGRARRLVDEEGEAVDEPEGGSWQWGSWDSGWWSPWDHKEIRGDRVVWTATRLWRGTYTTSYVARATTPGRFVRPPAQAEEMYDPAVYGRSEGSMFTVRARP